MNIGVVQDRELITVNGIHHKSNLLDFYKYLDFSNKVNLLATERVLNDSFSVKQNIIDPNKVKVFIAKSDNIFDKLFISKHNRQILESLINSSDLIVIKMPSVNYSIQTIQLCNKLNKKYVLEVCGCAFDSYWYYSLKGKLIAPFSYLLTRLLVQNAAYVVYVTRTFLQKRYPTKGLSLSCSNVILKDRDKEYDIIGKYKNLNLRNIKIGTLGPIDIKFRGQHVVIKAIAELKKNGYNINYYLAGNGSNKRLNKLAKDLSISENIHYLGLLNKDELQKYFQEIDLYVHPSFAEGLPRALLEAMSAGVACMGSETAGIPELIDKKYIFRKNNVSDITKIIMSLNKEDLIDNASKSHNKSKEYNFDILSKRRKEFFEEIISINKL